MCAKPSIPKSKGIVSRLMIVLVRGYQLSFSAIFGRTCRHLPSCSSYTIEALSRFGAWRGFWLGLSRIMRCHPWGSEGYDPVPETLENQGLKFWRYGIWKK